MSCQGLKSTEIFYQLYVLCGIAPVAIIDRQLPFEYTIASRSTDVMVMALPVQNINHSAFRSMFEREKLAAYDAYNEVACLILESMTPELHRQFENSSPYDMIKELKSTFEKQAEVERLRGATRTSWLCAPARYAPSTISLYHNPPSTISLNHLGKDHGRIILNLVENGQLVWPTVKQEDGTIRLKTYEELSDKEKLQADCDLKATNIVLQGPPPDVYALVNHHKIAKDIWDKVKLLISSSNPKNLATVQDGRVTVQQVQGRQGQNVVSSGSQGNAAGSRGNTSGQAKVIKCYNCQWEGHMARQCTHPKRKRDVAWFKEKVLLVQAHVEGKELDEEQLAFLADPGVTDAKPVLMAILSSCDSDVLFEVPSSDTSQNDMMNQSMQELQYSELSPIVDYPDNEITSDSNIIPYS
ncbi:retrovirus-related pol polyprotein from transposon TNT 1-94 [Tanacetum coccineum]